MAQQPEPAPEKAGSDCAITCPRCNHNLNGTLYEPTMADKVAYIALVMGDHKRFRKTVSLFGGRLTVTFRSLLTSEENLALTQVDDDVRCGKFGNLILYAATLEDYRLLMSIENVQRAGRAAIAIAPITDYEYDKDTYKTALPEFKEWLDEDVFLAASVRNAVAKAYFEFAQVLKYLETKAPDDPFFVGIG